MADAGLIEISGIEMKKFVDKVDRVIELLLLEMPDRSLALDVALLDLRDACRELAESLDEA